MGQKTRPLAYLVLGTVYFAAVVSILTVHSSFQQRSVLKDYLGWSLAVALVALATSWLFQVCDIDPDSTSPMTVIYTSLKSAIATFLLISGASALFTRTLPRQVTVSFAALQPVLALASVWPNVLLAKRQPVERILVVGTPADANLLQEEIERSVDSCLEIVGFVNCFGSAQSSEESVLGNYPELSQERFADVALELNPDIVVVDSHCLSNFEILSQVSRLHSKGVKVRTFVEFFEQKFEKVPLNAINEAWFLFDTGELHRATYFRIKQVMDLVGGFVGTLFFLGALPFIALAIKIDDGGPIFYKQERLGKDGQPFRLIKFRTMRTDAEANGPEWATPGDRRVTRVGRFLRRARLDELPQFINVLRGEMAIVGPRAERPEFVKLLEEKIPFYSRRHLIKPGLTGWAQIKYHYGSSVEHAIEKLQYEFYYMKYQSVFRDISIILQTLRVVLALSGQ